MGDFKLRAKKHNRDEYENLGLVYQQAPDGVLVRKSAIRWREVYAYAPKDLTFMQKVSQFFSGPTGYAHACFMADGVYFLIRTKDKAPLSEICDIIDLVMGEPHYPQRPRNMAVLVDATKSDITYEELEGHEKTRFEEFFN